MRILIVKTSSLGDIIHTFPVAAYLRGKFPEAEIDWVVERPFAELVEAHPMVDRVLTIHSKRWRKGLIWPRVWGEMRRFRKQLQRERYDLLFDLQGNCKSGMVTWLARADEKVGFARDCVAEWPNLLVTGQRYSPRGGNIRHDLLNLVQTHFDDHDAFFDHGVRLQVSGAQEEQLSQIASGGMQVLVHPGSAQSSKELPTQLLGEFLAQIGEQFDLEFLLAWGSDAESEQVQRLERQLPGSRILPRLPLPMLQNLMGRVELVVSMDSLPLHLCGTTATPSFSFFGPSRLSKYKPIGAQHHGVQGACPYGKSFEKRCPVLRTCATAACMRNFKVEELYGAFASWWEQIHPPAITASPL